MKFIAVFVVALLLSSTSFAQTQTSQPQSSGVGSFLVWSAGVLGGVFAGDYLLGGTMAARLVGITPQYSRYSSILGTGHSRSSLAGGVAGGRYAYAGGTRSFMPGFGVFRLGVLIGSGLLGGWLATHLF